MTPEKAGRGAIMLKYAAIGECVSFVATLFFVVVTSYTAYVFKFFSPSAFNKVIIFFVALLVWQASSATYRIWKRNSVIKNNALQSAKPPVPQTPLSPDEKAVVVVAPISWRKFPDFRNQNEYRSIYPSWFPQNSLIITDRGLLFVYAPLYLGDQMFGKKVSVADSNFVWADKLIVAKIHDLLEKNSLKEVYESYPANFRLGFDEIESIQHPDLPYILLIKLKNGSRFIVTVRSSDDYEKARQVLGQKGF